MLKLFPAIWTLLWATLGFAQPDKEAFITVWNTSQQGISKENQIAIPTTGNGYNYRIYWEDVSNKSINGSIPGPLVGPYIINFASPGRYRVYIFGNFPRIYFNEQGDYYGSPLTSDAWKLAAIEQWGTNVWTSMAHAFQGCRNLLIQANDTPDLSQVSDMSYMFAWSMDTQQAIYTNINGWDVSNVKNMSHLFNEANFFNTPLNDWDVSNVTDMSWMFSGADFYNQPLDHWHVANVTDMSHMFDNAYKFNQHIGSWNVSNVTDMSFMFIEAEDFNQPLAAWDVGNVTNMSAMFNAAMKFNQPINNWKVGKVKNMSYMFGGAINFNQPLDAWDVSNVIDMKWMFIGAQDFNQPLGTWDVSNVLDMENMLSYSGLDVINYDQTLIGWSKKNVNSKVPLGADGLRYCAGEAARMQLMNSNGWQINGDIKSNQPLPLPEIDVTQPLCKDSIGTITIMKIQTGSEQFSFDGGTTFQSGNTKTGLKPGTYSVIYKTGEGCSSSATTVVIDTPPILSTPLITGSSVVCPNVVGGDYSASIYDYTYHWIINGGTILSQQSNKVKIDWGPTNFNAYVKAVGFNKDKCQTDTADFSVKIQIKLKPQILSGLDSVCYNFRNNVPYQSSYTNGSVYTWFTDGGVVAEGQSTSQAKINWRDLGKYNLWVKEENSTSTDYCEGISDTLNVTVFKDLAAITMNFVSADYKDDKKVKIQWDATLLERISDLVIVSRRIAGGNESWQVVATLQKNIESFLDQNIQTDRNIYEYKVEGFNKCDEGLQTVIHNTIKLEGEKEEEQELIDLYWNDYNGWDGVERYEIWRKLDNDTTYRLIDVTPGEITNYSGKHGGDGFTHMLRIKAKKQNENIISWSNEIKLDFENPLDIIPNVITPDGDDKNEYFVIPKLNLYPDNYLKIFNRWGEQVYERKGYSNNWNGDRLPTGIYYYQLYLFRNNQTLKGWVQVVR
jgi:gliding motility-associated-like protein